MREDVQSYLDDIIQTRQAPGVVVAIAKDGKPLLSATAGVADVSTRKPMTRETPFALGELSFMFASTAALAAVDQGRMKLDAPLEFASPLTLRNVLSRSCGVDDFFADETYLEPDANFDSIWKAVRPKSLVPKDETSSTNGLLLTEALRRGSNRTFEDAVRTLVLKPLGMNSAAYGKRDGNARGYEASSSGFTPVEPHLSAYYPFAGYHLSATADDLLKFDAAIVKQSLLKVATWKIACRPVSLNGVLTASGLGLTVYTDEDGTTLGSEGGSDAGVTCFYRRMPSGLGIVVMANAADLDVQTIAQDLDQLVINALEVDGG
ncbi:MAG: beta-lactamase family protein [Chthonomonas sp.]|nr:beta-lactamase family protein [Chthonomonas sp.]